MRYALALSLVATLSGCAMEMRTEATEESQPSPSLSPPALTIEQLIDIRHPSNPMWSPDGRSIAFVWDRAGVANLYLSSMAGEPRALTRHTKGAISGAFWSRDGQRIYYPRAGDLWQVGIGGGAPAPVWTTPTPETSMIPSPDGTRVAFVRGGTELWVRTLSEGSEVRLATDPRSLANVTWSPDGERLSYVAGAGAIRHEQTPEYSGAKIVYTATERTPGQLHVVSAAGATAIGAPGGGAARWLGSTRLVFDRQSADYKRRTMYVADVATSRTRVLREDVDEKFWSITGDAGAASQPSPDGKWMAFVSDRDGWDHIYVMPATGGDAVQITRGTFEAWRPAWSPDSTRLAFDANEPGRPGTRHLGVATIAPDPSRAAVKMLTSGRGTNIAPVWSPDGTRLVYQHTDPQHSADLLVIDTTSGSAPLRLTDSMPEGIDHAAFVEPQLVWYPGPDGQAVPGWLYVPPDLDRSRQHPAIVWIHGDGVNQNYDGWHVQRNYAVYSSFHQYLLQQGYIVFAPDYRGSIGYGRDWRQGVYMDVGGHDAKDAWMAVNYLRTRGYVDMDRIGVWGLSYGGFFTLIAVTDQPRLFRAAVNVAGVADYAMYYDDPYRGGWTTMRIGTPEQNPEVYAQASPLSRIGNLESPLLVLHGTADVNVPYLHSVRLVDELLKQNKGHLTEFMSYPGEFHYFTREHVLRDAWHRVDRFFAKHLRGEEPATR
jgi:dipeptidyl aminopeptidase/acylaminoacyl peptidase